MRTEVTSLGLAQVVEASVLGDPTIRAAFANVLRERANEIRARTLVNPLVSVSQTLNPFHPGAFNAKTRQGGPPQLDVGVAYNLQRLIFGTRRADIKASQYGVEASLAAYGNVARVRILQTITAYVDVLEAKEFAGLALEELRQIERMATITDTRVSVGRVGRVEADRVHVALVGGRTRVLLTEAEVDNARTRLRALLGPAFRHRAVDVAASLDVQVRDLPPLDTLISKAMSLRPDLQERERRLKAAQAGIERERRVGLPDVTAKLGYTRQFQQQAIGFPDANSWGAGLDFTLPVFNRNQGGVAAARADLFEVQAQLVGLQIEIEADVEQAYRTAQVAGKVLQSLGPEALAAAESARDTIQEAYSIGGRTLLELLDAQQAYREVYRQHVAARASYLRAIHRLNTAVGEDVIQ